MVDGKAALTQNINKTFERQDFQKALMEKKGLDVKNQDVRKILTVATLAMGQIESGFKDVGVRSDGGNNSAGVLQIGPDATKSVKNQLGVGKELSNTDSFGNTVLGISYYVLGLGSQALGKVDSNKLVKDFNQIIQSANTSQAIDALARDSNNLVVEAVRDYNGGTDSGVKKEATIQHAVKFIKAVKENADGVQLASSSATDGSNNPSSNPSSAIEFKQPELNSQNGTSKFNQPGNTLNKIS